MKRLLIRFSVLVASAMPLSAHALDVFACEPEWGSLADEIAGSQADITVATTAFQDPHRLQAKPSLIAAVRSADLVFCTGADLEIGWLPLLLRRAGNPDIQPGAAGNFMASDFVRKLEVPKVIDRSLGDIHPQGNPHVHMDPRNVRRVAKALAARLAEIDPENASHFDARLEEFLTRWDSAILDWEQQAVDLTGLRLASNHRSFSYLAAWIDLDIVATLEPRPGIPASGTQLVALLEKLSDDPPVAVIRTAYANERASQWLTVRMGIPGVVLPYTVGASDEVTDLFTLFDNTIAQLLELLP